MRAVITLFVTLLLSSFVAALPFNPVFRRAAPRSFAQISIANGVGGNALAEAKAKFPGTGASLTEAQITQFNTEAHCAVVAEQAFLNAGAIASSNRATNGASVGLFKNKVLKIYSTLLVTQAVVAKAGGKATAAQQAQIADLTEKLAANVKIDQTNKGVASQNVAFTCPS